jgi:hypothetical protein
MFLDMIVTPGDLSPEGLAAFHFRGARHLLHRFAFGEQLQHLPLPPTQLPQRNLVHGWPGLDASSTMPLAISGET